MNYDFRYRLENRPTGRADGSGYMGHDVIRQSKPEGGEDWTVVPGRHKTVCILAADVQAALAAGSNAQIIAAYKAAFDDNLDTQPVPITGWDEESMQALMDANDAAAAAATATDTFITVDLGKTYPVGFSI